MAGPTGLEPATCAVTVLTSPKSRTVRNSDDRGWKTKEIHDLGRADSTRTVVLVETFVERDRFRGTVYQAANWQRVGATRGRTRQDRSTTLRVPVKDIYVYPLVRNFREVLCHGPA